MRTRVVGNEFDVGENPTFNDFRRASGARIRETANQGEILHEEVIIALRQPRPGGAAKFFPPEQGNSAEKNARYSPKSPWVAMTLAGTDAPIFR